VLPMSTAYYEWQHRYGTPTAATLNMKTRKQPLAAYTQHTLDSLAAPVAAVFDSTSVNESACLHSVTFGTRCCALPHTI
jgi:hypothetical protein